MKRKFQLLAFFCGSLLGANTVQSQTGSINIVSTAVPFLRISPDARAGGMGDMSIAATPDANAAFWNLAKIPFAKNRDAVAVNYTPWLKEKIIRSIKNATPPIHHFQGIFY
ncbi:MAG: hypothetical protein FYV88_5110 [Bacteroidetes bacterium]|nr:hypothetical protein [Bacteroidota bacterium]